MLQHGEAGLQSGGKKTIARQRETACGLFTAALCAVPATPGLYRSTFTFEFQHLAPRHSPWPLTHGGLIFNVIVRVAGCGARTSREGSSRMTNRLVWRRVQTSEGSGQFAPRVPARSLVFSASSCQNLPVNGCRVKFDVTHTKQRMGAISNRQYLAVFATAKLPVSLSRGAL